MKKILLFIWFVLSFSFLTTSAFGYSNQMTLDWNTQLKLYKIVCHKMVMDTILELDDLSGKTEINVKEAKKITDLKNDKVKELTDRNSKTVYYVPFINEKGEPYCMIYEDKKNSDAIQYSGKLKKEILLTYTEISTYIHDTLGDIQNLKIDFYAIPYTQGNVVIAFIIKNNDNYIMSIEKESFEDFPTGKIYTLEDFAAKWNASYSHKKNHFSYWIRPLLLIGIAFIIVWPVNKLVAKINK